MTQEEARNEAVQGPQHALTPLHNVSILNRQVILCVTLGPNLRAILSILWIARRFQLAGFT